MTGEYALHEPRLSVLIRSVQGGVPGVNYKLPSCCLTPKSYSEVRGLGGRQGLRVFSHRGLSSGSDVGDGVNFDNFGRGSPASRS